MSRAIKDAMVCGEVLSRLPILDLGALRQQWRSFYKTPAPPNLSRELLVRAVAYRMQELALGGLRPEPQRQLLRIAQQFRVARRFGFNPKKSGPDHAVPVIFRAMAESER